MRHPLSYLVGAAALAGTFMLAPDAQAIGLDACGDIFVDAGANCEVLVEGGCRAQCEPFAFNASCAVEGALGCSGSCDIEADVGCTGSCEGSCQAECEADPGSFDCRASCEGNCSADCSARCSASNDRAECEASCEATCGLECEASCDIDAPSVDCEAQCQACCTGECRADINMDCQIDCQADLYVDCKAELEGGCEAQCERPQGALFCDGQFINVASIDDCIDALRDLLNIEVEFEASASFSASFCTISDDPVRGGGALLGFGLLCLLATVRRR